MEESIKSSQKSNSRKLKLHELADTVKISIERVVLASYCLNTIIGWRDYVLGILEWAGYNIYRQSYEGNFQQQWISEVLLERLKAKIATKSQQKLYVLNHKLFPRAPQWVLVTTGCSHP